MALDIRLDFMNKIDPSYVEQMTMMRGMFIAIDNILKTMADDAIANALISAARTVELARTYNEQACQSTIKSLCILGETKE